MAGFHNQVKLNGFDFPDSQLTFNLKAGIVVADIGKAVALDSAKTVKLAGDGDTIIGVLYTVEDRVNEGVLLGTVKLRFAEKLTIKTGETVVVGDSVVGAGGGEIKADVAFNAAHPLVVDVSGTTAVVLKV